MNYNEFKNIRFMMIFQAITFIIFGCYMSKYQNSFYLGLLSVITGIIWFNWCLYIKLNLVKEG